MEEAIVTTALTAPNQTILSAGVELKFVPVIVIVVPTGPEEGENEVIVGACANKVPVERISTEIRNNLSADRQFAYFLIGKFFDNKRVRIKLGIEFL